MRRSLLILLLAAGCASNPVRPHVERYPLQLDSKPRPQTTDCDLGPGWQDDSYRAEEDAR